MTSFQRVIKYLAIALAIFIIVNICSGILFGLSIFAAALGLKNSKKADEENVISTDLETISSEELNIDNIDSLNIELAYSELVIEQGDQFKVETNNKKVEYKEKDDEITIEEGSNWFSNKGKDNSTIKLTIPNIKTFEKVNIEVATGKTTINELNTNKLRYEMGTGTASIKNLHVFDSADIDGGVGKTTIESSSVKNLDLDTGVGSFSIEALVAGKSKIDTGIGKVEMTLLGDKEDYTIKADTGIGKVDIDGKTATNNSTIGDGEDKIDVDGGIGSVSINFKEI